MAHAGVASAQGATKSHALRIEVEKLFKPCPLVLSEVAVIFIAGSMA